MGKLARARYRVLPKVSSNSGSIRADLGVVTGLDTRNTRGVIYAPRCCDSSVSLTSFLRGHSTTTTGLGTTLPPKDPRVELNTRICVDGCLFSGSSLDPVGVRNAGYTLVRRSFSRRFSRHTYGELVSLVYSRNVAPVLTRVRECGSLVSGPSGLSCLVSLNYVTRIGVDSFTSRSHRVGGGLFGCLRDNGVALVNDSYRGVGSHPPRCRPNTGRVVGGYNGPTLSGLVRGTTGVFWGRWATRATWCFCLDGEGRRSVAPLFSYLFFLYQVCDGPHFTLPTGAQLWVGPTGFSGCHRCVRRDAFRFTLC